MVSCQPDEGAVLAVRGYIMAFLRKLPGNVGQSGPDSRRTGAEPRREDRTTVFAAAAIPTPHEPPSPMGIARGTSFECTGRRLRGFEASQGLSRPIWGRHRPCQAAPSPPFRGTGWADEHCCILRRGSHQRWRTRTWRKSNRGAPAPPAALAGEESRQALVFGRDDGSQASTDDSRGI